MDKILEQIAKLIDVKTIVTFILVGVFAYLAVCRFFTAAEVIAIVSTVIAFYFGTQKMKQE